MAKARLDKTLADYVAIAVSPVLIMLLVGSLVFFLFEVFYDGPRESRLGWVLFWFVLAMVLVSRIAIEKGSEYAAVYGLALAGAVSLVAFRFVPSFVGGILVLLGIVWWCTNKLTWDCTLIDENEDASGEGLLRASGLERDGSDDRPDDETSASDPDGSPRPAASGWRRYFGQDADRPDKPHAPGMWVVYFSLAALPVFGIGQLFVSRGDDAARGWTFRLLCVYLAAGLALLVTTSFLGLRRYLRQRRLPMPASMTAAWLTTGGTLLLIVLVVCLVLPRPEGKYTVQSVIDQASEAARKASRYALLDDDTGKQKGKPAGRPENDERADGQAGQTGGQPGGDRAGGERTSDSSESKAESSDEGRTSRDGGQKPDGRQQSEDAQQSERGQQSQQAERAEGSQRSEQSPQQAGDRRQGDQQSGRQPGEANDRRDAEQQRQGDGGPADQENGQPDQAGEGDSSAQQAPPPSPSSMPDMPDAATWIGRLVKWLLYAAIAAVVLYFLWRNWQRIVGGLLLLWHDLLSLFGRRARDPSAEAPEQLAAARSKRRPFAAFENPFLTGRARRMKPAELVVYTFEALEAWAADHGMGRPPDQTALEFSESLTLRFSTLQGEVKLLAHWFTRLAYAEDSPTGKVVEPLERLWRKMSR